MLERLSLQMRLVPLRRGSAGLRLTCATCLSEPNELLLLLPVSPHDHRADIFRTPLPPLSPTFALRSLSYSFVAAGSSSLCSRTSLE